MDPSNDGVNTSFNNGVTSGFKGRNQLAKFFKVVNKFLLGRISGEPIFSSSESVLARFTFKFILGHLNWARRLLGRSSAETKLSAHGGRVFVVMDPVDDTWNSSFEQSTASVIKRRNQFTELFKISDDGALGAVVLKPVFDGSHDKLATVTFLIIAYQRERLNRDWVGRGLSSTQFEFLANQLWGGILFDPVNDGWDTNINNGDTSGRDVLDLVAELAKVGLKQIRSCCFEASFRSRE